jgi:outer membrane protein assembly factor BamD
MPLRPLQYFGLFSVISLFCACASAPAPVKSADAYFRDGEAAYSSRKYEDAIAQWKKVREAYSSPELSTRAELKIADAHFENKSYIEAAAAYEDFRKLHPRHEKAAYALYRLGLSNYLQVAGIDTDQTPVKNAVVSLRSFLIQYPNSEYAPEVKQKLADCRSKQLEYENYVGNFYLRTGKYPSAIKRLNEALVSFPDGPKLDQTLFYLGKAQMKAGNLAKAREAFGRLAAQFPLSPLNADAVKLQAGFNEYSSVHG